MKVPLRKQRGFSIPALAVALALVSVLATFAGSEIARRTNDSSAESTGRYLMAVRNGLIAFQLKHEALLSKVDISGAPPGMYPAAPTLTFTAIGAGQEIADADVSLLRNENLLPDGFSDSMPFGDRAKLLIVRSGTCPGASCQLQSYVYSCHPISRHRTTNNNGSSCINVPAGRNQVDQSLLGKVLLSVDGYGGHDMFDNTRFQGPLISASRDWFSISAHKGRAVVVASLDATPYAQFVRQGDTRHIMLRNALTVDGALQTNTALVFGKNIVLGGSCNQNLMFAPTADGQLAVCRGALWQIVSDTRVTGVFNNLVHNASVAPPVCPSTGTAFRHVSLQATDTTVTQGSGLNVYGTLSGTVSGSGTVNAAGNVNVGGNFSGNFNANPSSFVRMGQSVSISAANRIVISPNGANARASLIQGCTFN